MIFILTLSYKLLSMRFFNLFIFIFLMPIGNGLLAQSVYLPGPTCEQFYEVDDGYYYLLSCPEGLYFNAATEMCDWPSSYGCDPNATSNNPQIALINPPNSSLD